MRLTFLADGLGYGTGGGWGGWGDGGDGGGNGGGDVHPGELWLLDAQTNRLDNVPPA